MTGAVADGMAALARHDWDAAFATLSAVAPDQLGGAGLDALADAAWWVSRIDDCITAREGAFRAHAAGGDEVAAGEAAAWLFEHHMFKGRPVIAASWLRRSRRALDAHRDAPAYARLLLSEAELQHGSGQLAEAAASAGAAIELARRLGHVELEALGLQTAGRVAIDAGDAEAGFCSIDDAMLLATDGVLSPYATGKIYCSLISACDAVGDYRRAAEWTEATLRWSQQHPLAVFPGLCRVHRAQVLGSRGSWDEAIDEARRACDELEAVNVGNAAAAWAEIGDILRRVGDLPGAEAAFAEAERLTGQPPHALALLRLAEGRIDDARKLIDVALGGTSWNRLARARLLPARVQIAIAADDLDVAGADVDELEAIAADYATEYLVALSSTSRGRLAMARGECDVACRVLRDALAAWTALDVPYEVATTQLLLGHVCWRLDDEAGAGAALGAAAAQFRALGAATAVPSPDELRAKAAGDAGAGIGRDTHGLTLREREVLGLIATGMTNKDISGTLGVSPKTVARHVENIFTKLGVGSRAAATAFAFTAGLVPTS